MTTLAEATVTKTCVPDKITLELTPEEAQWLRSLGSGFNGGYNSGTLAIQRITDALDEAGIYYKSAQWDALKGGRSLG